MTSPLDPLMLAIVNKDVEKVYNFLRTNMTNIGRIHNGYTPIMLAVIQGNVEIVSLLIETGEANVGKVNDNGVTALMLAAQLGNVDIVKLLIATGEAEPGQIGTLKSWQTPEAYKIGNEKGNPVYGDARPLGGMVDFERMGQSGVNLYKSTKECLNSTEEFFGTIPSKDQLYFYLSGIENATGKDLGLRRNMSREELCAKFANYENELYDIVEKYAESGGSDKRELYKLVSDKLGVVNKELIKDVFRKYYVKESMNDIVREYANSGKSDKRELYKLVSDKLGEAAVNKELIRETFRKYYILNID